jgi:cardiolipin synthase
MLEAIGEARNSVSLEVYTFSADATGERFRQALVEGRRRGVRVRVLVDAVGSIGLAASFWDPLSQAGGEVRQFNPLALRRFAIRDHRKVLVCDGRVAFVGGYNVGQEYEGDGVGKGWKDVCIRIGGPVAGQLEESFERMFGRADFLHKRFMRFRKFDARISLGFVRDRILLSGPGRGASPYGRALREDLAAAKEVSIVAAYFLPPVRLLRDLMAVARRGGRVRLVLPGKSDVALSRWAARSLYRRLLKSGVEVHEYEPQILHAKLVIVDEIAYVGSANLDPRSLHINYELMLRLESPEIAAGAREVFAGCLAHSRRITREEWRASRTIWRRVKHRWAYFILARVDPWFAQWQWRGLED